MSNRLPQDGVELVLKGSQRFVSDLGKVNSIWDETSNRFRDASGKFSAASKGMTGMATASKGLGVALGTLGTAAGVAVAAVGAIAVAFIGLGAAIAGVLAKSVPLAGKFQEMEFTALAIGRAMGLTEEEIRGAADEIEDLGIRTDVANKTVAQFARNQLDLSKATELVRIAQATAIITGDDSTASMESLTRAITTGSTVMLRRMGIMVDNQEAEKRFAKSIGVDSVDALTQQQKMLARTNAIIESGTNLLDVYDAAMESPTKRMRSLTGRVIPQLGAAIGAPFLGAWSTVIKAITDFTKALTAAVEEGGALYPLMIKIGAVASIMADAFASGLGMITNSITGMTDDVSIGIAGTIEEALRWGVELVAAFAEGMVEAATSVLVQAMNFISNILSQWLLGASPPKIAPGIADWGISLMDRYLQGMTQADFGILKGIQGPLKKILGGPAFADLTKALAGSLAGGDRESFIETVGRAAGVFSESIQKLARINFELADAVTAVEEAEESLSKSRTKVTDAQAEVNKQTREYNRLLREGASDEFLRGQLGQINAAESSLQTTMAQVDTQEEALKQAKERHGQLEAEKKLQGDLVDQLLGVNAALIEKEKAEKKAAADGKGKGKGKGLLPDLIQPEAAVFDISSKIGTAIDKMKAQLQEKFKDIFSPLTDAWDAMVLKVQGLGAVWDEFKITVGASWDALKEKYPIIQDLENVLINFPAYIAEVWRGFTTELQPAFEDVTIAAKGLWQGIQDVWTILRDDFWPFVRDTIWPKLAEFGDTVLWGVANAFGAIAGWIGTVIEKFQSLITDVDWGKLLDFINPFVSKSPSPFGKGLKEINDQLTRMNTLPLPAAMPIGGGMLGGAMVPQPMGGSMTNNSIVINNGGNTINGGIGMAGFQSAVERSVRNSLRR